MAVGSGEGWAQSGSVGGAVSHLHHVDHPPATVRARNRGAAAHRGSVTDAGWYAIACEWKSDTVNSLVDREVGLFAGGTRVAFDRRAGIDGGYTDAGWVAGTLTAPAVFLPIGGLIYAEADGDHGETTTNITRLTITRTND